MRSTRFGSPSSDAISRACSETPTNKRRANDSFRYISPFSSVSVPLVTNERLLPPLSLQAEWSAHDVVFEPGGHLSNNNNNKVLLYLHGGAYIRLSPRTHRPLCLQLSKQLNCRVLCEPSPPPSSRALSLSLCVSHPWFSTEPKKLFQRSITVSRQRRNSLEHSTMPSLLISTSQMASSGSTHTHTHSVLSYRCRRGEKKDEWRLTTPPYSPRGNRA